MTEIKVGKVAMVDIMNIDVGERARQDLGDLESLEESLKESGLIQPLAVMKLNNGQYELLAGERRFTVLLHNKVMQVPVRIYDEGLTELEMKVIEKSENFYRKDMEYWEYDKLIREIHELQQSIHGTPMRGPGGEGHKLKDTAEMFNVSDVTVHSAIQRAEAKEAFPELFVNCKTANDATKIIKKMDEQVVRKAVAEKVEAENKDKPTLISKLANAYILEDFFKGVKKIKNETIQFIEIDPPYGIDLNKVKKRKGESQYIESNYNEISAKEYQVFLRKLFKECYRVLEDHSWLVCWFAPEPWFEVVYLELIAAGFKTTRMCPIWIKPSGQTNRPDIRLPNSYEMFFYAWKGSPALNKAGHRNVFDTPPIPAMHKTHPTERPVELMREIYDIFARPGSRVMIPFLGSGNGLLAAHSLGMSAFGYDLGKGYRDSFLVKLNSMG